MVAALREVERDVALEADGEAEPCSGGEEDGASASGCGGLDGFVDGGGVDGLAVADGAEAADVEDGSGGECSGGFGRSGEGRGCGDDRGGGESHASELEEFTAGGIDVVHRHDTLAEKW